MKKNNLFILLLFISFGFKGWSQIQNDSVTDNKTGVCKNILKKKNSFFFYWGYNRSAYTKSDIHFWGDGYDFTIYDVRAKDSLTTAFVTYIKPNTFTVPQYNYRLGYFLTDKVFISLGEDHMKYEIEKQATRLSGTVTSGNNIGNYDYTEVLVGEGRLSGYMNSLGYADQVQHSGHGGGDASIIDSLPKGFVSLFEHCDGLNDVSLEIGRMEELWISKNNKYMLTVTSTLGSGMVIPDSDARVLGQQSYHNQSKKTYHLAGYSFSASVGFQLDFFKHFFIHTRLKSGYINLPGIKTTIGGGKASQHFSFLEPMVVFGYSHTFKNKN